jgi:hypothetical protein
MMKPDEFEHTLGRHSKIGTHNFDSILHHCAPVGEQKSLKILCFVPCVEDYHKLINTIFNPLPPRQSDDRVDEDVACLSSQKRK